MTVGLIVVRDGEEMPGYALRAGDHIERIEYSHNRRVVTAYVGPRPGFWRFAWQRFVDYFWRGL